MKKGIFVYCSDKRTAFSFEKKLREELGLKAKEIIYDLALVPEDAETVLYIDKGDIPSDYRLKGKNTILVTEGMDFHRWKNFNARNIQVYKLDPALVYLKEVLNKLGYNFEQKQIVPQDTELKPHIAGEKLGSKEGLVGIYSVKDGVGKSTVALNLAGYIKEVSPDTRVLLLDMDSFFTGIQNFVDRNIGISEIDLGAVSALGGRKVCRYNKLDLYIMPSNNVDENPNNIVEMLKTLKKHFDLIIIDINSEVTEQTLTLLNCVSILFIVADNRTYIKEGSTFFAKQMLPKFGIQIPEQHIILNKSTSLESSIFEDKFNLKVIGNIEADSEIYEYEERKLLYSLGNKKSSISECIQKMIKVLKIDPQQKARKKFEDIFS